MKLEAILHSYGLFVRGTTELNQDEIETYGFSAAGPALALVGNIGSSYWPVFSRSPEFSDGQPHPLDRWSRRVAEEIATELPLQPVYPFEGPPYYPFQQWAHRAEALEQSPIGVMIHPEFGLWHSYRFALLGAQFEAAPARSPADSPCLGCETKPCLHRCPVDAFDSNGYDVERCRNYLRQTPQAQCHETGCLARYACPIAPDLAYTADQGQFHLKAFLNPEN